MKFRNILLALVLIMSLFTACTQTQDANPPEATPPQTSPPDTATPETAPDVMTTASIVDSNAAFEEAISNNGTWIICTLKDLTFDNELILDGEFKNGKKDDDGKDIIQRKIALYTQDENRNVTGRFNLTAPKLTINSPNARIQSGTFIGDVYVSAENFQLVDATIEGNLYFMTEDAKSSFTMDETSSVTGAQEMSK
ncbi:hypothetical protein J2Z76_000212 [Sedimentibacter acidaminivorans]|uniref:Polymer-forming protein n=1 Tax=Sedimentibacter acidaminivorans TaxID=913099 RepID=A0ABS4G9K2_9FIRM|nr:hypothetical protein [Sedimentibacter acidaminivorans]MBP1924359.1 hypothetical protein [Sedimentibacter acidaminivorans]